MNKLELLVKEWEEERETFDRVNLRFQTCVKVFVKLNKEIYLECQKQGIDIQSLNLNEIKKEKK